MRAFLCIGWGVVLFAGLVALCAWLAGALVPCLWSLAVAACAAFVLVVVCWSYLHIWEG